MNIRLNIKTCFLVSLVILGVFSGLFVDRCFGETEEGSGTFVNPLYRGADPFLVKHTDGFYYYCESASRGVFIWKSDKMTEKGTRKFVWRCPRKGWNTSNVWAPELHLINGKWYIYYAADTGDNSTHRTGVLEGVGPNPQGRYIDKGLLYTGDKIESNEENRWAIDATPLEMNGKLYLIWSGWKTVNDIQSLYIAEMENPWTIKSNRVKIVDNDTYVWERVSNSPDNKGLNEGPQILKNGGKVYVIYSCSGSWEVTYKLGQLSINEGDDPMKPENWTKRSEPVFKGTDSVYGVGHCSFVKSPDGKEDWVLYHSKVSTSPGWNRDVRMQRFGWNADGSPDFGTPVDAGIPLKMPSGQK